MVTKLDAYKGSQFVGKLVLADVEFFPELDKVNQLAAAQSLEIFITSSARQQGRRIGGAIVKPATFSNHLIGHAIDMNIRYDGTLYNSLKLRNSNFILLPPPIQTFITRIREDKTLRWGGDFNDPVHIDDGLNIRDRATWRKKYDIIQTDFLELTSSGTLPGKARILLLTEPLLFGKDVLAVQKALIEKGFDIDPDEVFGVEVDAAVTAFQEQENLTADGRVGPNTLKALGLPLS
ncbi:MAG: peptidoglycan-binding protein [Cyanobacteria bacterium J06634_5]